MAEQMAASQLSLPYHRIILQIGSLGAHGEFDEHRLSVLPLEAHFSGHLHPTDRFEITPQINTTCFLADWIVEGPDKHANATRAIETTESLRVAIGLNGVEIKTGRRGIFYPDAYTDPNTAWEDRDMEDISIAVHSVIQAYHSSPRHMA